MHYSPGRKHAAVAVLILGLVGGAASAQTTDPPEDLGRHLVARYIAPAMQSFESAAADMEAALATYCEAIPAAASSPLRSDSMLAQRRLLDHRFGRLVASWSGIAFLRFGPLVENNRFERIFFWPDPRGVMLRQIQGQLAAAAKSALSAQSVAATEDGTTILSPDGLARHSVAIQGLPALEYMLYRDNGLLQEPGAQDETFVTDCAYARAIAGNLNRIGNELSARWTASGSYAAHFSAPASGNPMYRNTQEVAAEAIKAMSTGLQFVRDIQLLPMLGDSPGHVKIKKAPFWRSDKFGVAMAASASYLAGFHEAGDWPYGADQAWIGDSIRDELCRAAGAFGALAADASADLLPVVPSACRSALTAAHKTGPQGISDERSDHGSNEAVARAESGNRPVPSLASYAGTDDGYRQLLLASLLLKNAKSIVDENMAPAFGARIGFNALDGD